MEEKKHETTGATPSLEKEEIVGQPSEQKPEATTNKNSSAENTLSIIADIVLVLGIIGTVVCLFTIVFVGRHNDEFNPVGFGITLSGLLSVLISWSVMKVLANISLTLKGINKKLKPADGSEQKEDETRPKSLFDYMDR